MPVVLLCHCDGTNGQTTFTDVSPSAHTLTNVGTQATVTTTNPRFGTGCVAFTAGLGTRIEANYTADFNFGSGQFTLEAWVYYQSAPGAGIQGFLTQWPGGASTNIGWFFGMVSGQLTFYYSTTGLDTPAVGAAYTPTLNAWTHYAVDRDASNVLRVYANGVVIASATVSAAFFASTRNMNIGCNDTSGQGLTGILDEARITKGTAQYGGAFTPPTAPFGGAFTTWSTTDKSAANLSGVNLVATSTSSGGIRAVDGKTSGNYYWEFTLTNQVHFSYNVGIAAKTASFASGTGDHVGVAAIECGSGSIFINNTTVAANLGARTTGNIIGIALDVTNSLIWFRVAPSGNWNNSGTANPATGTGGLSLSALGIVALYPLFAFPGATNVVTANFGDSVFTGTVPSGFTSGFPTGTPPLIAANTQTAIEEWGAGNPDGQVSQIAVEQWASVNAGNAQALATIIGLEQWASVTPPGGGAQARVMVLA